ncbi:hypothetical protein D3870_06490 [Noviherbaspirillum cavernae]|uniref:Ysc84 actin-binding domain-containing protein n=1 Tax=Noviherbaspirillum cavernae TaxID=2320862 RepID=A0A418WZT1_9BURK|nr:lipid-binding SYLF domain-containing protein [Noviherbaspirillum cavernae]RJG05712.1 hypothetical protein D3870_06490 [Noviherbaspirillum cavernae]
MHDIISRRIGWAAIGLLFLLGGCASTAPTANPQSSVNAALATVSAFKNDAETQWLWDNLKRARAVLIVSPRFNTGVALTLDSGSGIWSGPAFYNVVRIDATGAGMRVGEQNTEMIAAVMSQKALNWLLSPSLPRGELNIVTGPYEPGNSVPANADVVVFSRTKGEYGPLNLAGMLIAIDKAANQTYYGLAVTPEEILMRRRVSRPEALPLQKALTAAAANSTATDAK